MPEIIHIPIVKAPKNEAITFSAAIADTESGVSTAVLYWRKKILRIFGWEWSEPRYVSMTTTGHGEYEKTLSASQVEDRKIRYYITAKDKAGNIRSTLQYTISRY